MTPLSSAGKDEGYTAKVRVRWDLSERAMGPTGMPSEYHSTLSVFDLQGRPILQKRIRVNDPLTFHGITFYQSSYGTVPGARGKVILNIRPKSAPSSGETVVIDPGTEVFVPSINRSIRALGNKAAMAPVGKLIFDENWRVRNEAVQAFTALGERSLDTFLEVLTGIDRYAKDSICEEIEMTNFSGQLIKNLKAGDQELQKKSRQVLEIMHSLGFSTPLSEFLAQDGDETQKELIRSMMKTGPIA